MYSISKNTANSIFGASVSYRRTDAFKRQRALSDKLIREITLKTMLTLMIAFGDAKNELEKQAVIEAAQEVGHLDLAIDFMEELT